MRVRLGAEEVEAVAYEVIEKDPDAPPATPEYTEVVLRGARERGLPEEWLTTLRAVLSGTASVPAP